jgi:uncharacterized protein (DUF1501 family)
VKRNGQARVPPSLPDSNGEDYKAVVYVHLFGGMDSFYMLAPHPSCGDLYDEYKAVRSAAAALKSTDMLEIDASSSEQPCDTFGLNKKLPIMKELYDNGHGLFFANTGHLTKPVSKYK